MKRIFILLIAFVMITGITAKAHAVLINRGTDTLGNRLIYDDDLDITWYDYSNTADDWLAQVAWAGGLSVDFGGTTYDDWRLPSTVDGLFDGGYDGTTTAGYNITTSEMGHLFYTELGNKGYYAIDGTNPQPGWGLSSTGDFQNLVSSVYWSGTEYATNTNLAWNFLFNYGNQYTRNKDNSYYALAVRSGDVVAAAPVPEPTTIALLGIGLAGMGVYGVRRRR